MAGLLPFSAAAMTDPPRYPSARRIPHYPRHGTRPHRGQSDLAVQARPVPSAAPLTGTAAMAGGQAVVGISCSTTEQTIFHIHAHLTVFVNGAPAELRDCLRRLFTRCGFINGWNPGAASTTSDEEFRSAAVPSTALARHDYSLLSFDCA